jgi:hypothetical protein
MQAAGLPLSDDTLNILSAYEPSGYPPSYSPSASYSPASASPGASYSEHKPKTPPPDLPSLLLDSRIVYIGMPVSQFKFIRGGGAFKIATRHRDSCLLPSLTNVSKPILDDPIPPTFPENSLCPR